MLAAYQAALNTFVNNRNPQQGGAPPPQHAHNLGQAQAGSNGTRPVPGAQAQQQQNQQNNAPGHDQRAVYAMQAPPMLAYMPVLVSCLLLLTLFALFVSSCVMTVVH